MAKATSTRPSELLVVEDRLAAFCFDRAVFTFGTTLKGEINKIEAKDQKDHDRKLDTLLRRWLPETKSEKKFADPAGRANKK